MRRTWICAAVAAALAIGASGYAVAQDKQPNSSQQMQKDRDRPPGDAQTPDKRGERAQTAAPLSEGQAQSAAGSNIDKNAERARGAAEGAAQDAERQKSDVPSMGESQKPYGKVGP
jgi:uncharacterized protein HemX